MALLARHLPPERISNILPLDTATPRQTSRAGEAKGIESVIIIWGQLMVVMPSASLSFDVTGWNMARDQSVRRVRRFLSGFGHAVLHLSFRPYILVPNGRRAFVHSPIPIPVNPDSLTSLPFLLLLRTLASCGDILPYCTVCSGLYQRLPHHCK